MAKILSDTPVEVLYRKVFDVVSIKCDCCGRTIPAGEHKSSSCRYYEVDTGHGDWGVDSSLSVEHKDVCVDCAPTVLNKYLSAACGTEYLKVRSKFFVGGRVNSD